jgi:AcrR family transcriptional regulator
MAAPLEEIARRAGVSKQTVYNHFGSKVEIARAMAGRRAEDIAGPLQSASGNPEEALTAYARGLLRKVCCDKQSDLMRAMVAAAAEAPDIARAVYEAGPMEARRRLAEFLRAETAAGRLKVDNPVEAASMFGGMVLGHRQIRTLLRVEHTDSDEDLDARARECARRFIRAFAP